LTLSREADEAGRVTEARGVNWWLGLIAYWHGDFLEARTRCERAIIDAEDPNADPKVSERFGEIRTHARSVLAATMWQLGAVERARELIDAATGLASKIGQPYGIADALFWKSYLEVWRGDPAGTLSAGDALERVAREHGMPQYLNEAELHLGWARGRINDPKAGAAQMQRVLAAFVEQGVKVNLGFYTGLLAQLEAETLGSESALTRIDEAFRLSNAVEHGCSLPFLHRLRGEILLKCDPSDPVPAEEAFRTSIAIAKEQSARGPALLASLALAILLQSTGRPAEALAVLTPALEGFSPRPEMPEIAEAHDLLTALAATDEVKAAIAQQQRRGQLQVAYGQALIAARGFSAPETAEAFAKARAMSSSDKDTPERLAADTGLWAASYARGDLASMRAYAADLLADVANCPNSPEAAVAHRLQGMTHWYAGEFLDARDHLERALAQFQSGRDDDLALVDPGVSGMAYLAFASWPLGDIDYAASLLDRMNARIADLTHAHTLAHGTMHAAMFALMSGNLARAHKSVSELARIVREYDLRMFRAFGEFLDGWAVADGGALADGLEGMRRGAKSLREQNALVFDGLIKIALSDVEARTGDLERAIVTLDEALATVERIGYRAFEADLHRARGEMLLRRDPADFAEAEQALQTAVAIARQQGTRAFELRAALSLAKLYQLTDRPVEAHAVLTPALEGFSPTPEMPEIAEAQAVLESLAHGGERAVT
jgi:predicted ATPase